MIQISEVLCYTNSGLTGAGNTTPDLTKADLLWRSTMAKPFQPESVIGSKYGRLTVLEFLFIRHTPNDSRRFIYRCQCDCGVEKQIAINSLRTGRTRSCGCLLLETRSANAKHGAARDGQLTPEWRAWRDMLTRATNPKQIHSRHYVGRGIGVCKEWTNEPDSRGFERFFAHVGPKPSPQHSLDRIDNDKGYEPGNVRWATRAEQARNKSTNRLVTIDGQTMCLADACLKYGVRYSIARERICKLGWSVERALKTPKLR